MKDYDYYAVAFDGEVYCTECLPDGIDSQTIDVYPIFAGSEWESYPVCCECGEVQDYVSLIEEE